MPKTDIDYSNTIIYKITCKNPEITDVYVGHTTNFVQRKHAHKQNCINEKALNYKCKLYNVIRTNGGWANWQMEIINFFNCADHYEARKKEQEYFISLNATLNSIEPFPKPKVVLNINKPISNPVFFCKICNINCKNQSIENHNNTANHIKKNKFLNKFKQIPPKFMCEVCHYGCRKESDFKKHLASLKHKNGNKPAIKETAIVAIDIKCARCNKQYKTNSGLWKHNKVCTYEPPKKPKLYEKNKLYEKEDIMDVLIKENHEFKNIIIEVVKNNAELQKQNHEFQLKMMEMCKKGNNINTNNSYNNNKTFNLQFFLNEQCKDAMNLTDFVDSMELEFSDLEDVGKLGYVEGISKIMIRKLNEMDIYKRPIHCSDAKREIMYVKEDNVWEKEKNSNQHIRKAIKRVTHKNGGLLVPWSLENPNCMNLDHHLNDVYLRMMGQSMGGSGEFVDNENKIMKKIAKAVFIDKNS
jgi:hypothetical protein